MRVLSQVMKSCAMQIEKGLWLFHLSSSEDKLHMALMWLGISGFEGADKLNPQTGPLLSDLPNGFEGAEEPKPKPVEDGDEANPQEVQPEPNDEPLCVELEGVAAAPNNDTLCTVGVDVVEAAAVLPKLNAEEGAVLAGAPNKPCDVLDNDVEVGVAAVLLKEKDVFAVPPKLNAEGAEVVELDAEGAEVLPPKEKDVF